LIFSLWPFCLKHKINENKHKGCSFFLFQFFFCFWVCVCLCKMVGFLWFIYNVIYVWNFCELRG
jgi:hypothetical protein